MLQILLAVFHAQSHVSKWSSPFHNPTTADYVLLPIATRSTHHFVTLSALSSPRPTPTSRLCRLNLYAQEVIPFDIGIISRALDSRHCQLPFSSLSLVHALLSFFLSLFPSFFSHPSRSAPSSSENGFHHCWPHHLPGYIRFPARRHIFVPSLRRHHSHGRQKGPQRWLRGPCHSSSL